MVGKTAFGAVSPAKPALQSPINRFSQITKGESCEREESR